MRIMAEKLLRLENICIEYAAGTVLPCEGYLANDNR